MSKLKVSAIHDPDNDNLAIGVDSSGKVGIGTTSPVAKLQVKDSTDNNFTVTGKILLSDGVALNSVNDDNTANKGLELRGTTLGFTTNGTERMSITSDGRGLSQFTAKAWVNFNGTGTLAIRDSHNVSSVSDNGTGNYTVNLSNALANSNAVSVAGGARYSGGGDPQVSQGNYVTGTTTVLVRTSNTAGSADDHVYIGIVVFGD